MKTYHQVAYSETKVLYNSRNSGITSFSSQYTPHEVHLSLCMSYISCVCLHFVRLIVSSLLCLPMPVLVNCVILMTNTLLASHFIILDFVTFRQVTHTHNQSNWDGNAVIDGDGEAESHQVCFQCL